MGRKSESELTALIALLCADPQARIVAGGDGSWSLEPRSGGHSPRIAAGIPIALRARGLLAETEPGRLAATPAARAWLKRRESSDAPFRAQHGEIVKRRDERERDCAVLVDLEKSRSPRWRGARERTESRGSLPTS